MFVIINFRIYSLSVFYVLTYIQTESYQIFGLSTWLKTPTNKMLMAIFDKKDDGLNYTNGQFRTSLICGVSTGTKLWTGRSRVLNTAWEEIISFPNVRTGSGVHPASYAMRTGVLSRGISGRGVWLVTQLHLVPRLRMSTAITAHRLYAFLAGRDKSAVYKGNGT